MGKSDLELGYINIVGFQFCVRWHHWRGVEPKVTLLLTEQCQDIMLLAKNVRHFLTIEYGRGKALVRYDNIERKMWDRRYVRVQMTAISRGKFSALYIEHFRPLYLGENCWAENVVSITPNI